MPCFELLPFAWHLAKAGCPLHLLAAAHTWKDQHQNNVVEKFKISPDHRAPDEAVLDREHVRVFVRVCHAYVRQFYVQVLKGLDKMTCQLQEVDLNKPGRLNAEYHKC